MSDYRIVKTSTATPVSNGSVDFGLRDQKGRAVGYTWTVTSFSVTLEDEGFTGGGRVHRNGLPTDFIEIRTSPTRDGRRYGPAFNTARFATLAEAEKQIAKRTEAARKSNTKKFAAQ